VRNIYLVLAALSLLIITQASWALGLGEITVNSKLGEPFKASVTLSDDSNLSPEQIKAVNAPMEIYNQMQIDNSFIYQSFKLAITNNNGALSLDISTKDPIREPYLDFVIQVKWPGGQVNKEFKVFIDPS